MSLLMFGEVAHRHTIQGAGEDQPVYIASPCRFSPASSNALTPSTAFVSVVAWVKRGTNVIVLVQQYLNCVGASCNTKIINEYLSIDKLQSD